MFIECKDGAMVNLSHVVSISKYGVAATLMTVSGTEYESIFSYDHICEAVKNRMPANSGFKVISVWFDDCNDPEAFDIVKNIHEETVIAWKGMADNLEPVTLFGTACDMEGGVWAVLDPAGSVIEPGNRLFVSLDHWVAGVRETLRAYCEKRSTNKAE